MVRKSLSAWTKNNLREIKYTWERYVAILAIITLGVAFFAGLVITKDTMVATLDNYLTDYKMYDYRMLSTIGFDKDDAVNFSLLEGIEFVEAGISIDFISQLPEESNQAVLKAHSITNKINHLQLISGHLPNNPDECVVDSMYFSSDYIGKTILVSPANNEETKEGFSYSKYTIVGTVKSPEYISQQRGTTNLANGSLDSFIYIPEEGFDTDYYTDIYIKLEEDATPYSKEYASLIANHETSIQTVLDSTAKDRYEKIIDEANEKIAEGQEEYEDAYKEYLSEKEKALNELEEAYIELTDGEKEIEKNEEKLLDGEKELKDGWKQYNDGLKKYEEGLEEYNKTKASSLKTLQDSQKEINDNRTKVIRGIKEIEDSGVLDQYNEIVENLKSLETAKSQIDKSGVRNTYTQLQDSLAKLKLAKKDLGKNRQHIIDAEVGLGELENSNNFIYIKELLRQYDNLDDAKTALEIKKVEMLKPGSILYELEALEEKLLILEQMYSNDLSDAEKDELADKITNTKSKISSIKNGSEYLSISEHFMLIDHSLNYLYLKDSIDSFYASEKEINSNLTHVEAGISKIENSEYFNLIVNYDEILLANISSLQAAKSQIEETAVLKTYTQLKETFKELDKAQVELDKGLATANLEFEKAQKELNLAKSELDTAYKTLSDSQKEFDDGKKSLREGQAELNDGFKEYEDGKLDAKKEFTKAEKELEDASLEINDAKKEVADVEFPTTYMFDRSHNSGYSSFDNDSAIVAGIAKVLPIFFFLVAALVCSSTMSRMVDEQRTQIGTLKALGYSDRKIINKYVLYAASSALFACGIGYYLGTKYFPIAIWKAYGILYDFAPLVFIVDIKLIIFSLVLSLLCSAGATYLTCKNELLKVPAALIRPKSPKAGKRIFLERIPAIWKQISFLPKVSIRNIFRYKKRLLMTVMGIAGCTALIVAALGIKDSIGNIANYQFDDIMTYDFEIYYSDDLQDKDKKAYQEKYGDLISENVFLTKETFELVKGNQTKTFNLIATDDKSITNIINFNYEGGTVSYPKDGEVLLSHSLAEHADVSIGDTVTIKISDTKNVEALVGGIFENHIDNYMFMSDTTYKMLLNEEAKHLNSFAKVNEKDLDTTAKILLDDESITAVVSTHLLRDMVDDTMISLDYVIWLVLGFALALAFVVVYNLNNINITERAYEIATLKVLGFYQNETHSYVFRENLFLTALGIFVGLILGNSLLTFIMAQIQVDFVSFKQQIFPLSFLVAIIITFLLTILVNWILRGKIDKIDMTESLNSGE